MRLSRPAFGGSVARGDAAGRRRPEYAGCAGHSHLLPRRAASRADLATARRRRLDGGGELHGADHAALRTRWTSCSRKGRTAPWWIGTETAWPKRCKPCANRIRTITARSRQGWCGSRRGFGTARAGGSWLSASTACPCIPARSRRRRTWARGLPPRRVACHPGPGLTAGRPMPRNPSDPLLLTPGPVSVSASTKAVMMVDRPSGDKDFEADIAHARNYLVELIHGGGPYTAIPVPGSATY